MPAMTSKERIMATINHEPVDHVPLCVDALCHGQMRFVTERHPDRFDRAKFYMDLGLDTGIGVGYPATRLPEHIETRTWREDPADEDCPLLHKEYVTPKGNLKQVVRKRDYPADSISLFSDHNVPPGRSKQYLVSGEEDIGKLECMFAELNAKAIDEFFEDTKRARKFCDEHQIVLSAYTCGVGDPVMWMSGVERAVMMALTEKEVFRRYVQIVSGRHQKMIEVAIDAGVDLIVRRGWYESTDFWSPDLYEEFFFPALMNEVKLAHEAGVKFTYIMNSGATPLLELFTKLNFDIYSNFDPLVPGTDVDRIKTVLGGRIAVCGGLNNYEILEEGTEDQVRDAVADAIEMFSPDTGFILAPGDGPMSKGEIIQRNFYTMIDAWKTLR